MSDKEGSSDFAQKLFFATEDTISQNEFKNSVVNFKSLPNVFSVAYNCSTNEHCDFTLPLVEIEKLPDFNNKQQFKIMCEFLKLRQRVFKPHLVKGFMFEFPDNQNMFLRNSDSFDKMRLGNIAVMNMNDVHQVADKMTAKLKDLERTHSQLLVIFFGFMAGLVLIGACSWWEDRCKGRNIATQSAKQRKVDSVTNTVSPKTNTTTASKLQDNPRHKVIMASTYVKDLSKELISDQYICWNITKITIRLKIV